MEKEKNFGSTPLHDSARENAMHALNWHVESGADAFARNNLGQIPMELVER